MRKPVAEHCAECGIPICAEHVLTSENGYVCPHCADKTGDYSDDKSVRRERVRQRYYDHYGYMPYSHSRSYYSERDHETMDQREDSLESSDMENDVSNQADYDPWKAKHSIDDENSGAAHIMDYGTIFTDAGRNGRQLFASGVQELRTRGYSIDVLIFHGQQDSGESCNHRSGLWIGHSNSLRRIAGRTGTNNPAHYTDQRPESAVWLFCWVWGKFSGFCCCNIWRMDETFEPGDGTWK